MKTFFYFVLGCILAAPAALFLFSGEFINVIISVVYSSAIYVFVPTKVWRRIFMAHVRASKLLEG